MNPKTTVEGASTAIVQDIMRSLVTRLEMHWDSLTEEEDSESEYYFTKLQLFLSVCSRY